MIGQKLLNLETEEKKNPSLTRISTTGLKARDPSYYKQEKPPKLDFVAPIEERKGESITLVSDFETYRMNKNNETPNE